ncbi:MAG TPA: 6-pyruvoyl-tetrahydropterin synthase-related protein, partial [Anaerolineae bacterium]|nr:6-pyruvoyl-tetrahydropterin synthase-related protein [Anaerolineae bacterium]
MPDLVSPSSTVIQRRSTRPSGRELLIIGALLLLLIPALWPLLDEAFFVSLDGPFHVYRVAALAKAWGQGVLHPRIFPEFGFGYGQAVLNYYPPLSYWPAAGMTLLGVGPTTALELTIALGFLLAALGAYGYVRYLWGPGPGLLAALVYTYFPYHLIDAYERGAVPEHLAFAFLPLILWSTAAAFRKDKPLLPLLWSAILWAGLVCTHSLTALMMVPVTASQIMMLAGSTGRWRRVPKAAAALALAAGLSSMYWLPMLLEVRFVGLSLGPTRGYENHFLGLADLVQRSFAYEYAGVSGQTGVHPLSWLSIVLILLALSLLLWRWRQRRLPLEVPSLLFHLGTAVVAVLMTSTVSRPLWRLLTPVLGHLQYPWRFMVLVALGLSGAVAALPALLPKPGHVGWLGLLVVLALVVVMPGPQVQPLALPESDAWSPERMWLEDAQMGQVGATWTGEFLPVAVKEQRWALGRSAETAIDGPALASRPNVRLASVAYDGVTLEVDSAAPLTVSLHQFHLPAWAGTIGDQRAATYASGDLALVTADLPAGETRVSFRFGPTQASLVGNSLAILTSLALCVLAWRTKRAGSGRALMATAAVLVTVCVALMLNSLGVGRKERTVHPTQVTLGDVA